jgi:glycerol-3-phosphate dehydrogenase
MVYTDAVTDDARLTFAIAATGFAYGGLVLTRAEVVAGTRDGNGRINGVVIADRETGRTHRVRARVVVNATGVWVDQLRSALGVTGQRVRPSRGSHVLLPTGRLPLTGAVTVPSPDDGRPVFFVPHPEGVLVGTTDLFHEGPLDDPRPTAGEVGYLVRAVQAHFPRAALSERDVVGAFAGLRPTLDIHAENPSAASRDEDVWGEEGLLSVAGGKLTTWRVTAEEAVDAAIEHLPDERARVAGACPTKGTPLAGLAPPDLADRLAREYPLSPAVSDAMARRLGSVAWHAPRLARGEDELAPLVDGADLSAAEVRAHLAFGAVSGPDDLLLRRARLGVWDPPLALAVLPHLRPLFEQELGWTRQRWGCRGGAHRGGARRMGAGGGALKSVACRAMRG